MTKSLNDLNQIQLPPKVAVLGKGMLKNNTLLSTVLKTQIVRQFPILPAVVSSSIHNLSPFFSNTFIKSNDDNTSNDYSNDGDIHVDLNNSQLDIQAFIGWGNKKSYQRAKHSAKRQELPVYSIEDGFIRSIDSGLDSRHALSVVVDDLGIYFDSTQVSRLEQMICHRLHTDHWSAEYRKTAKRLIDKITHHHLSKYNGNVYCPDLSNPVIKAKVVRDNTTNVLLIDQVAGDNSISGASIDEKMGKKQFAKMLKDVFKNHPQANIWIKAHPAGKKGYLTEIKLPKKYRHRIHTLTESVNPIALLKQVSHVYTVSSHMGFEALLLKSMGHDINVHCYGVSWYSGWGVTDDSGMSGGVSRFGFRPTQSKVKGLLEQVKNRRAAILSAESKVEANIAATIEQLFFSAYLDYSHYVDPASNQSCDLNTALDWLIMNRKWQHTLSGSLTIYEFSRWKLPFVRSFVDFPKTELCIKPKRRWKNLLHPDHFIVKLDNPMLVWGLAKSHQVTEKIDNSALEIHAPVFCMEDGFIRSNGLGATLLAPLSVVIDSQGIYYNATKPSDLETLLLECPPLTNGQIQRVRNLQQRLLAQKVSKYNVGNQLSTDVKWVQELRVISAVKVLIVGQVEDDLSVQYCGSLIKTNAELIRRVQQNNPQAYLVYKPHPDVEAGLRSGNVDSETLKLVNEVAKEVAMPDCLALVDEVHTMSSLTGFEAILRGIKVCCYGLPFYAGWGLTTDMDDKSPEQSQYLQRRQREKLLSLHQLIHCTLIEYPLYRLPDGYGLAQVEQVVDYLYPLHENFINGNDNAQNPDLKNPDLKNLDSQAMGSQEKRKTLKQNITQSAKRKFMRLRQKALGRVENSNQIKPNI